MSENEKARKRNRDIASPNATEEQALADGSTNSADVAGILDERIRNLGEAIDEIDAALARRKVLDVRFIEQIDREAEEVKRHLNMLNAPWQTGFYPEVEFLRLSFHKSLTSRAKERRSEQLKYWENGVNLAKERRKFLDEYKALVGMRRRLSRNEDR